MSPLVDVAVNYYGKPWQTRLTIDTLLEHSGRHIGTIYLAEEPQQPRADEPIDSVVAAFPDRIVVLHPQHFFGWGRVRTSLRRADVRRSARYQQALEMSDKRYVLLCHNDVEFGADLVGELLRAIRAGGHAGAGLIGQCWNCPASTAGICDSERQADVRLSYLQALSLSVRVDSPRTRPWLIDPLHPLPLPECRLNEFACLIDVETYRRATIPEGRALPIGVQNGGVDIGSAWFHAMVNSGYSFAHVPIWDYCVHDAGHPVLFDASRYDEAERVARAKLQARTD